jgi:hypothetical protein
MDSGVLSPIREQTLVDRASHHLDESADAISIYEAFPDGRAKDAMGLPIQDVTTGGVIFEAYDEIDDLGDVRLHAQMVT